MVLVNLAVAGVLRRRAGPAGLRRLSLCVFAADCVLLFGLTWVYSFDRDATIWVILYVLGVEGAVRFGLAGALAPVAVAFPLEALRDLYRQSAFGYPFGLSSVTYRVGIMALIGAVAGVMARNLERQRAQAESLAARERAAREELEAFHEVVLAGYRGGDFSETMERVVGAMASALDVEAFSVALVEERPGGAVLRCIGASGHPPSSLGRTMPVTEGICGAVAREGSPRIVTDTHVEPAYAEWIPGVRSELCVPILDGEKVLGIIDVESREAGHFTQRDLERLERLAPQIGLILTNARLLAQERATVAALRELDTMKSDFVAITSHELRTPLTSIRGFVKTMRRPETAHDLAESERYLAIIDRQTDRLSRLVEDLLIVSRIEAGSFDLDLRSLDVESLLREVIEDMGPAARRVTLAVGRDLRPVVGDADRLGQVVRNLVDNALKFSPASSRVDLRARCDDGRLLIEVSDAGPGIPHGEIQRVFERFYQVGGSMRRRGQGAGLGLYIARWLVEALGGTISVASEPWVATTFTVSLPIQAADQAVEPAG